MSFTYKEPGCGKDEHKRIFFPLKKLGECANCRGELKHPYLCKKCGEAAYCSEHCQAAHWHEHGEICGITDRISLETFYPFLACIAALAHAKLPPHFALLHRIVNDPEPSKLPIKCTDNWTAKLVIVDDRDDPTAWAQSDPMNIMKWFPKASCESVAQKLYKRILYSGNVLPILTALGFSILAEIYTTTSGHDRKYRRARLKYKTSPIKDFGVAKGTAAVSDDHLLAFCKKSDRSIVRGQDPKEHYWLWFKTIRDQEVILDLAMFTFDMCTMVATDGHVPPHMAFQVPVAPAYFFDREIRKQIREAPIKAELFDVQHCTRRSVLYDKDLAEAVTCPYDRANGDRMRRFMERVSSRAVSEEEMRTAYDLSQTFRQQLAQDYLGLRLWETSPPSAQIAIAPDPGEGESFDERCREFWARSSEQLNGPNGPADMVAQLLSNMGINPADLRL